MTAKPTKTVQTTVVSHPDLPQHVVVDSLPKQSQMFVVQVGKTPDAHRDAADWTALGLNGVLAVVGIIGIIAAFKTLRFVRSQTTEMGLQRKTMQDTLEAMKAQGELMKRQADAMESETALNQKVLLLQYRPKVIIRVLHVAASIVAPLGQAAEGKLRYEVANVGGSKATLTDFRLTVQALDNGVNNPEWLHDLSWVGTFELDAGESKRLIHPLSVSANEAILKAKMPFVTTKRVLFAAVITYKDDLGIARTTKAWRWYDPTTDGFKADEDPDREFAD